MNTIRELKQQEKYKSMLKRKNKEKKIYKDKNASLQLEKQRLYIALRNKDEEIERLNNIINELSKEIFLREKIKVIQKEIGDVSNKETLRDMVLEYQEKIDKAIEYMNEVLECYYHGANITFDVLIHNTNNILKGVDKE